MMFSFRLPTCLLEDVRQSDSSISSLIDLTGSKAEEKTLSELAK